MNSIRRVLVLWLLGIASVAGAETYTQSPSVFGADSVVSQTILFPIGGGATVELIYRGFDNFQLSETTAIAKVAWQGSYFDLNNLVNNPAPAVAQSFGIYFLSDSAGMPGASLGGATLSIASVQQTFLANRQFFIDNESLNAPVYSYSASLPTPFAAQANTPYWLAIYAISADSGLPEDPPLPFWGWNSSDFGNVRSVQTNNFGFPDREFTTDRNFSLSAAPPTTPGDFDGDSDVDGADFVVWQTNFPAPSGHTRATGDADNDGDVDGADFVVWQTHFPTAAGAATTAVPEPAAGLLALLSVLSIGCAVRNNGRKLEMENPKSTQ